jgi:hypothetical protein
MKNLLAMTVFACLLTACAGLARNEVGSTDTAGPGATEAAALGYHGPVHRSPLTRAQ